MFFDSQKTESLVDCTNNRLFTSDSPLIPLYLFPICYFRTSFQFSSLSKITSSMNHSLRLLFLQFPLFKDELVPNPATLLFRKTIVLPNLSWIDSVKKLSSDWWDITSWLHVTAVPNGRLASSLLVMWGDSVT